MVTEAPKFKSNFEILKERYSAVENLFAESTNWTVAGCERYINRKTVAQVFDQLAPSRPRSSHLNVATFRLLTVYAQDYGIEVDEIAPRVTETRDLFLSEGRTADFLLFAQEFLPQHPEFNLRFVGDMSMVRRFSRLTRARVNSGTEGKIRVSRSLPVLSNSFLTDIMNDRWGSVVKKTLKNSEKSDGFSVIKNDIDRNYWNLTRILGLDKVDRSRYWLTAGSPDKGFYSYTPLANLTRLLIWDKAKVVLTEEEQLDFVEKALKPLWKCVFGKKTMAVEIGDKEGLYISRACYIQALYLLSKTLVMQSLHFGVRVGRKKVEFREA